MWDYSISQATLETIFMSFAKDQEEETASVAGVAYSSVHNDHTNNNDQRPQFGGIAPTPERGSPSLASASSSPMDVELGLPLGDDNGANISRNRDDGVEMLPVQRRGVEVLQEDDDEALDALLREHGGGE